MSFVNVEYFSKIDSTFSESLFITKVNNIFVQFFTAIMLDEMVNIDHFVSDEVYEYGLKILNSAKSNGNRQMYDELNVKSSRIINILENEDSYQIDVYLEARYMDYLINLETGDFVSGNNASRRQVNYNLSFVKRKDAKEQKIIRKCQHCGASMDVNASGRCEYCGSIYNQEDYSNLKPMMFPLQAKRQ